MASLSGVLQRPVLAACAVAAASVSADLRDKFWPNKSLHASFSLERSGSSLPESLNDKTSSWLSQTSIPKLANLSFVAKIRVPVPKLTSQIPKSNFISAASSCLCSSAVASSPVLVNLYHLAELGKVGKPKPASHTFTMPSSPSEGLYRWHLPDPNAFDISEKSRTVVVLLGWLGAKQKHLNRYAEWYTSKGFHAITFTFPMNEVLSYQVGGKAEQEIELLVNHLADWLEEENGKNLVFHTFSNTGWLTYGVALEKFQNKDPTLLRKIKGSVVDSAPVASPDPQVWASGFSAAFLKKNSVATKGAVVETTGESSTIENKPRLTEEALLVLLRKFFELVLNLPAVNKRLSDVFSVLTSQQPSCPQLYIYSSADRVIPAGYVESFIDGQRRNGHIVRSCNFISTPHVDHFRNDPKLYTSQLSQFLEECVLTSCKSS